MQHAIKDAYKRNAKLDAEALTVETEDDTVTVKGTVKSWAEHDEALDAAWSAPGVREVHDRILVLDQRPGFDAAARAAMLAPPLLPI